MRAAEPAGPIADRELPSLFARTKGTSRIALAVSGGCDSLALLDCADRWRRNVPDAPSILVLSVDHGLRDGSGDEASTVVAIAAKRGLEAAALRWEGPKPSGDIEASARAARYRLLLGAARKAGASHLLLAHHRDDQAETLLLRLARGSGVFGLAAMRDEIRAGAVTILRPFIDVPRARLQETIAVAGLVPAEDPMNREPRYARARLRRIMPLLAADGIDPAGLAATARRLASAAAAIDAGASQLIASAVSTDDLAIATVEAPALRAADAEIRQRVVVRLLLAVGGEVYPPRHARLAALIEAMDASPAGRRVKRTLSGVVVERRGDRLLFYREIGRSGLAEVPVERGFAADWDHRFHIDLGGRPPPGLRLGALGAAGRRQTGLRSAVAPASAVEALPAFRLGGRVVAVPSLGHARPPMAAARLRVRSILGERLREPPAFPDFLGADEAGSFTLP